MDQDRELQRLLSQLRQIIQAADPHRRHQEDEGQDTCYYFSVTHCFLLFSSC